MNMNCNNYHTTFCCLKIKNIYIYIYIYWPLNFETYVALEPHYNFYCHNPTLRQVWGWDSHSQKWELGVLRDSHNFRTRLQRSKHLSLRCLYTVGKALKCRCRKWPCMSHLDICNTSYGRKKGRESNWQFDSRPQKVENRPDPRVFRWSVINRWKVLEENYKFASDLIPIWGMSRELWAPKVPGVSIGTISGLLLGSPGKISHLDVGAAE
jgi:hypothetical protein